MIRYTKWQEIKFGPCKIQKLEMMDKYGFWFWNQHIRYYGIKTFITYMIQNICLNFKSFDNFLIFFRFTKLFNRRKH